MAKQIWDIDVRLQGEKEALKVQDKLTQGELDRKTTMEKLNSIYQKNKDLLGGLTKAKNQAFDSKVVKRYEKEIAKTKKEIEELGGRALPEATRATRELDSAGRSLTKTFAIAFITDKIIDSTKALSNLVLEIDDFNRKLSQNSGVRGAELDELSATQRGLARTFKKDQNELSVRANQLAKQMGESQEVTLEFIAKGFKQGADNAGELLNIIQEYPVQFKNAGLGIKEFIQFAVQAARGGSTSDKLLDTIKEAAELRLGEQTKAVKDALAPLGTKFRDEVLKGVETKTITKFQGFKKILERAKELNLTTSQTQKLIADLGGGALEDLGGLDVALKNINEAQKINLDQTTKYTKEIDKRIELDKEVAAVQGELAKELSGVAKDSQLLYQEVQVLVFKGLLEFINTLKAIPTFLNENKEGLIALGAALVILNTRFLTSKSAAIADTVAKKANTVATNLLRKATVRLKNALKTNPFGVVLAAATALYGVYRLLTKQGDRFSRIQARVEKAGNEATIALRKENVEFSLQIDRLKKLEPGSEKRKKLIEEINAKYKDYLPSLLSEKSSLNDIERAQKRVNDGYRVKIKILSKNKQVEFITDELAKLENANAKLTEEFFNKKPRNALQELGSLLSRGEQPLQKAIAKNEKLIKRLKNRSKELLKEIDEINEKVAQTNRRSEPSKPKPKAAPAVVDTSVLKALQDHVKAEKQAEVELKKLRTQRLIDTSVQAQKEEDEFTIKKKLIENEMRLRIRLAGLEKMQALETSKTDAEKLVAVEKFNQAKVQIERDTQEKLKQARLAALKEGKKIATQRRALERNSKNRGDLELGTQEFQLIEQLNEAYKKGEISYKDYEESKAAIAEEFTRKRYELDLAFLQNQLATQNLSVAKRTAIEQKILDLKKTFAQKEIDIEQRKNEKIEQKDRERRERMRDLLERGEAFANNLVNSLFENRIQREGESLERLQAQKEHELKLAGDSAKSREAIELKFAQKEKQIKQKQVDIQREQAIFQIASDTISSASKTAANLGFPKAIPFIFFALAEGGLRLSQAKKIKAPRFFHGSDEVKRLYGEPPGRDTILSFLNEGEGVAPTHINQELLKTGIGVTNPRLPELVNLGLFASRGGINGTDSKTNARLDRIERNLEVMSKHQSQTLDIGIGFRGKEITAYVNDQVDQQNTIKERKGL